MSDSRDTNADGHVSLMEKVKDKLHIGHKDKGAEYTTTTHTTTTSHITQPAGFSDSRDLNRDGYISTSEKLKAGTGTHSTDAFHDSRDLNRDGHVSTGEKLASATGSQSTGAFHDSRDLNRDGHISTGEKLATSSHTGAFDSRDLNRDGHISTGEKLASHAGGFRGEDEARLKLHEEQLAVSKREVGAGEVDIHKRVQEEHVQETIPVRREEVTVERRPLSGAADPNARIASEDEIVRVPLFREELVTEKRIVPTEEVIVRKTDVTDNQTVGANLRSEFVETSQAAHDARDLNRDGHVSMGEKFKSQSAFGDARDINRDGHVSMGEKLQTQSAYGDARDINQDGHVSMGEKLKGAVAGKAARG
jgi:uncharacterized protein (TIGR02271 family)